MPVIFLFGWLQRLHEQLSERWQAALARAAPVGWVLLALVVVVLVVQFVWTMVRLLL